MICVHGFGHAFMRIYGDRLGPALRLCRALGARVAADCAQGAFHDYWFAVIGADDARLSRDAVTDPRTLCASQARVFVGPCWYRGFIDNRPKGFVIQSPEDLDALCQGLAGLQRQACITAASVIGPPDPPFSCRSAPGSAIGPTLPHASAGRRCTPSGPTARSAGRVVPGWPRPRGGTAGRAPAG